MKIISPQYVKPFVRRQKNDGNDAEAICTATRQPHIPLGRLVATHPILEGRRQYRVDNAHRQGAAGARALRHSGR